MLDYVSSRAIANLIGFFVDLRGAVLMLGAIVGRILAKFFKWVGLSWLDRLLGGAFGLVRGASSCRRAGHGAVGLRALAAATLGGGFQIDALHDRYFQYAGVR